MFSLQTDDGEDDLKKGTQLLEIYALEIQMYTAQKNNKKLKALYEQSLHIKSAIPHPLIMGVIRGECDGFVILHKLVFNQKSLIHSFPNRQQNAAVKCICAKMNSRRLTPISSRRSKTTTNPDRHDAPRASSTSCWPIC